MPAEIISDTLLGFVKIIGRIFTEVILEVLIKGAGYFICKPFNPTIDSDSIWVTITGLIFWIIVITLGVYLYDFFILDSCLDSGGKYVEALNKCLHEPTP